MGFLDKVIGGILVGVFVLALIMFGYSAQVDNGVTSTILDDPHFSGVNDSFQNVLGDVRDDASTERNTLEGSAPKSSGDDSFSLLTLPRNIFNFGSMLWDSFNLVAGLLENVFGIPALIFNVLAGLLTVVMAVLAWRVIKGGGI